jgi:hypothetical protein
VCTCDEIAYIQIVRATDGNGDEFYIHPSNEYRDPGKGCIVDRHHGYAYPWVGHDNEGKPVKPTTNGSSGVADDASPAIYSDHPHSPRKGHGMQFETCAVCTKGPLVGQVGKIYGCVTWGYQYDAAGNFTPTEPEQHSAPSENWWPAIDAWNTQCDLGPKKDNGAPKPYKQKPITILQRPK